MKFYKYKFYFLFFLFLYSCQDAKTTNNLPNYCNPILPNIYNTPIGDSDPLYFQQWHLRNTRQTAYALNPGVRGVDLNLPDNYTGRGIVINIVDGGIEYTHEDLDANILPIQSRHFPEFECDFSHGTGVAGIIAAEANNGVGGRGIAYESKLISHNFLQAVPTFANFKIALNASADIVNQSFSTTNENDIRIGTFEKNIYKSGVENLRDEKGAIYVLAAGNGFGGIKDSTCDNNVTTRSITCQNSNMNPYSTLIYNIVVAAVNANEIKSSYSTAGSSILISGLGGEFGNNYPAIITTELSGCERNLADDIRIPRNLDENCNYTNAFNGTSAAVPTIAGVIALILEANPNLTWRDVRHILIHTAKKIDGTREVVKTITFDELVVIPDATAELGWIKNAVGLDFHNWYGFGLVDASAAVSMAENYQIELGVMQEVSTTSSSDKEIPNKNILGATDIIDFRENLIIESIQIDINITHPYTGDLGIFLKSPSGTVSLLFNFNNIFKDDKNLNMVLASQTFYGEVARGNWEIKVIDYRAHNIPNLDRNGILNSWKLNIYGHTPP